MSRKLQLGRYDYAGYSAFAAYALCSLAIPLSIVAMGESLHFPLDKGGMGAAGMLHFVRSAFMVAALLLCGFFSGRFGKRRTVGFAMILIGGGLLFCAMAPSYTFLFPCLLFAGFGEGVCEGVATPFVQDLHIDEPERYVSIAHSMWSVGIALCVVLTSALLGAGVSWRWVLAGCGIAGLLSSLMFLWKENPARKYPDSPVATNPGAIWKYSVAIFRTPRFWVYCLGMFMGAGVEFSVTFWAAAYLELTFRTSAWLAALGTGAIAAGMFLGRLFFGYYAKKEYLKHLLLTCGLGALPLTLLLICIPANIFASQTLLFAVLLGLFFLCGICIAPYWPILQVYGVNNLPELDSTMLYIYFSAVGIPGCGFFTWAFGFLGDHFGLRGAFLLIPCLLLLFSLVIFLEGWIFPRKKVLGR